MIFYIYLIVQFCTVVADKNGLQLFFLFPTNEFISVPSFMILIILYVSFEVSFLTALIRCCEETN